VKKIYFTALFISLLFLGCSNSESQETPSRGGWAAGGFGASGNRTATSVETQTVTLQPIAEQVRSYGTVKAQDVIAVTPQVSNRITRFYVDLGDTVSQGQLLAKINDATFRDQLNQAEVQLQQSRIALQRDSSQYYRQLSLAERDLVSEADVEIAEATYQNSLAQLQSAMAGLTQARENFSFTEIRSPVRGVIIARTGEEGDIAITGQVLFEVANLVGYETRVFLPVNDWRFVKIGQPVNLRVTNETTASARGIISRKSPQLDATTGLGEVVITLTQTGASIYPGVLTESVIDIENKPRAVVVPRSALVEKVETVVEPESNTIGLERTYSVFISVGDSVAQLRPLQLGIEQGDRIEVLAGLRPGERIIVTGQTSLQDGSKIRVASGADFSSPAGQQSGGEITRSDARPAGDAGRAAFANMSDDDRQKMRERMATMSQDERRALIDSLRTANQASN
jgi:RND family efflux transporter MFP subunit